MTENSEEKELTGKKKNQIKPGEKRSPGRPKGAKSRKTIIEAAIQAKLVDALEQDAEEIYRKAADMAKEGDKTMIKLFLQRLLPELKAAGEDNVSKAAGGIQITINSTSGGTSNEKDVGPVTINKLPSSEDKGEEDDESE